jgi:hypothetical protein
MRWQRARLGEILQKCDDGWRTMLLNQAAHGPCRRRVGDFGVARRANEAAVQR